MTPDELRCEVETLINSDQDLPNYHAQPWHAGGGTFGTLIITPAGNELFYTLECDGDRAQWTGADLMDSDGELVANVEVQVRPHGHHHFNQLGGTPEQFATEIRRLLKALR